MKITDSVALVTGANRGLGRHFAQQLLERGASKVYATARNPESIDLPGVEVLRLDVTDPASIAAAVTAAGDVTLLINNAGSNFGTDFLTGDLALIRAEMDVHYFGTLELTRAFAPVLKANGGGGVLNVLSVLSWLSGDGFGPYAAAKAAEWSLTNGLRVSLAPQGTQVTGLHLGYTDTDMIKDLDVPKNDPAVIVAAGLDGVEQAAFEVLSDDLSRQVKAALALDPAALYPGLATSA